MLPNQVYVSVAVALVMADFDEITPLTLKNRPCVFLAVLSSVFSFLSQNIPPLSVRAMHDEFIHQHFLWVV